MKEVTFAPNTAAQAEELPPLSDDDVLAYTRGVRVKIVQKITQNNSIGDDNAEKIMLVNVLNGLDSQALNNKKIANDQKNTDNMANIVAEMLRTVNKQTAFTIPVNGDVSDVDVSARIVPLSIADIPALPGEMDVSPPQLDYTSFVRSQGKDVDQLGKDIKHPESTEGDDTP